MFPDPHESTTRDLIAEAGLHGKQAASELGASIMSAVIAYLIAGAGPEKTAAILRDWAAAIMRRELK